MEHALYALMSRWTCSDWHTSASATVSLALACLGAGILSFPRALAASRLPAFLLVGAFVGCGAFVGLAALVRRTLLLCSARPAELVNVCYERNVG